MFSQRKNHCRSVSSSAMGLNTLSVTPALTARSVNSWVPSTRPESARPRQPSRSFSAESLHVIPQTLDIESQFQVVLGKCLFDKAVQIAEEGQLGSARGSPVRPYSASPCSSRPGSSYGSSGTNSPMLDDRTTLKLRPTRCTSPLVKGSRSFDSYINKGSIDQLAVAKTRGTIESPKPSIYRYLRRVKTASDQNLNDFSLKAEFTDKVREGDREQYWRRKKEEKIIEEETRERKRTEKAEMMIILEDMKKDYEERKVKEALELQRLQLEAERIAKEKKEQELALLENTENQINADDISVVSSSSKSSKKRSSKKGKASKKDKTSRKAKSARKSAKKKSSVAPSPSDAEGDRSGSNTPQPILKSDERRPSDDGSGETGQGKRVTFREKLVSTRTIRPHKPVASRKASPKRPFPGSSSSESRSTSPTPGGRKKKPGSSKGKRGTKKGTKKKAIEPTPPVEPPPELERPVPEPPPPEPVVEPEPEEPKESEVIIVEEPPEFCPAAEYRTRKQMVEEWLYYRSSSAAFRANPPIL
ncbi:uncharacterized protein DDB_G0284459-like [Patiria miniata]|uniref:Uncharacterized protein n=1 Tax=Patiria miniata TaxID=46514 RepID=A0A913Z6I8_PATMI|nr:uncharacterized protein DDB_G0284459-like [Patiria miniata]